MMLCTLHGRSRRLATIIALLFFCISSTSAQVAIDPNPHDPWHIQSKDFDASPHDPLFCVVVRTYRGHGGGDGGPLARLLRSLQRQEHQRWEAVLILADSNPFPDLHRIVTEFNDTRAWVFAEWVGPEYTAMKGASWAPDYHAILYNLTDDAIQVCPPDTEWLMVTNGDNEYARSFMTRVLQESTAGSAAASTPAVAQKATETPSNAVHIVAFDFYSRYQRVTAPACERFAALPAPAPYCKRNSLRWCQSDLGAAALRWHRFKAEGWRFGDVDSEGRGLDSDAADGLMMEDLSSEGWKAVHVTDACLFVHSPAIQACAWRGGAWDDRDIIGNPGGDCLTQEEADAILARDEEAEEVVVEVSSDGRVAQEFEGAQQEALTRVRCLRKREYKEEAVWGVTMAWYSEWCADDDEVEEFRVRLKDFYPTDAAFSAAQDVGRVLATHRPQLEK